MRGTVSERTHLRELDGRASEQNTHGRSAAAAYSQNAAVTVRATPLARSALPRPTAAIACSAANASASTSLSFALRATTAEIASDAPKSNASFAAAAQPVDGGVIFFTRDEMAKAARLDGGCLWIGWVIGENV